MRFEFGLGVLREAACSKFNFEFLFQAHLWKHRNRIHSWSGSRDSEFFLVKNFSQFKFDFIFFQEFVQQTRSQTHSWSGSEDFWGKKSHISILTIFWPGEKKSHFSILTFFVPKFFSSKPKHLWFRFGVFQNIQWRNQTAFTLCSFENFGNRTQTLVTPRYIFQKSRRSNSFEFGFEFRLSNVIRLRGFFKNWCLTRILKPWGHWASRILSKNGIVFVFLFKSAYLVRGFRIKIPISCARNFSEIDLVRVLDLSKRMIIRYLNFDFTKMANGKNWFLKTRSKSKSACHFSYQKSSSKCRIFSFKVQKRGVKSSEKWTFKKGGSDRQRYPKVLFFQTGRWCKMANPSDVFFKDFNFQISWTIVFWRKNDFFSLLKIF